MKTKLFLVVIIILCFNLCFSQTVSLDESFGTGGKTSKRFPGFETGIFSSKIQPDGKIVVCGFRNQSFNFQSAGIIIGRYNSNGIIDLDFGTNGFVILDDLFIDGTANKMLLLQSNGKILITGSKLGSTNFDFHTYRFNSNGTLDSTFGNNGEVVTDINNSLDESTTLIELPDGKIVVLGTYTEINNRYLCAVRYNSNGILDTTFGSNGKAIFGSLATNYSNQLMDVVLETNGKIVLGAQHNIVGEDCNFVMAKLNANGTIDTGFGTNGARITNFGADDKLMSIQKIDGKYYAFGFSTFEENQSKIAIARYSTSGSLDFSFGTNGKVLLNRNSNASLDLIANAKQVGDKILCVGYGESENQSTPFNIDALMIRLNFDGTIDTTFNNTGYILADFSVSNSDVFMTLEIQTDGKILAFGSSTVSNEDSFVLSRYQVSNLGSQDFRKEKFSVYPNPFENEITIEFNSSIQTNSNVEVFDTNGRKLKNIVYNYYEQNKLHLELPNNIAKGIYFVKVDNDNTSQSFKVLKK